MQLLVEPGQPPFTSAHRGFSTAAPENTMPALEAAWQAGATVAEIDVRLSRDGELVLMHDRALERTTDGRGPVSETSGFVVTTVATLRRSSGRYFPFCARNSRSCSAAKVDLVTKRGLEPQVRPHVLREAQLVYAA